MQYLPWQKWLSQNNLLLAHLFWHVKLYVKIVFNCIALSASVSLSVCLSVYLSVCLSICLTFLEQVSEYLHNSFEQFTCNLYRIMSCSEVNETRYQLFLLTKGKIESSQLPQNQHSLRKHIDWGTYKARI